MTNRWYVAEVHPHSEALALVHLGQQAYATYAPTETYRRVTRNNLVTSTRFLFPGYIFIAFDIAAQRWRSINGTRGVRHLLPIRCEIPLPLPIGLVEGIQARESAPEELDDWLLALSEGDDIAIGAAAGYGRRVVKFMGNNHKDRARVKIALSMFGREQLTSVARQYVTPI